MRAVRYGAGLCRAVEEGVLMHLECLSSVWDMNALRVAVNDARTFLSLAWSKFERRGMKMG